LTKRTNVGGRTAACRRRARFLKLRRELPKEMLRKMKMMYKAVSR
jgi:hypothetical protein